MLCECCPLLHSKLPLIITFPPSNPSGVLYVQTIALSAGSPCKQSCLQLEGWFHDDLLYVKHQQLNMSNSSCVTECRWLATSFAHILCVFVWIDVETLGIAEGEDGVVEIGIANVIL
jgi:hypothetical protein